MPHLIQEGVLVTEVGMVMSEAHQLKSFVNNELNWKTIASGDPKLSKLWLLLLLFNIIATGSCEIEQMMDCGQKVLCRGKGFPNQDIKQFHPTLGRSSAPSCYCDENCHEFGDCCLDKASYPNELATQSSWSCIKLPLNPNIYAVTSCDRKSEPLKRMCMKQVFSSDYHYIMDIPVYSNRTGLYYANIYCAYCNSELNTVKNPRLSVKCTPNITIEMLLNFGEYQKGSLTWRVRDGYCSIRLDEGVQNGRHCIQSISDCPPNSNIEISAKCNGYSYILSDSIKVYRNPHCAICNGANVSDLRCGYEINYGKMQDYFTVHHFIWKFDKCKVPESAWDDLHQNCIPLNCSGNIDCLIDSCKDSVPNDLSCQILKQLVIRRIDSYIMRTCLSVSVVCLLLHMFIAIFFPQFKKVPSKMFDSLAFCIVVAQVLYLCGLYPLTDLPEQICYMLAVLIQFFFLASFFWMNAVSIDICCSFSNVSLKYTTVVKKHSKYSLYAWSGAGLGTISSVVADFTDIMPENYRPRYAARKNICWFGTRNGIIIFFYIPVFVIVALNTILFTITVCWFQKQHRSSETLKRSGIKEYNRLWLYIKLSTIMGLSWLFGLIKFLTNSPIYRYLFTAFSGLQGAFIFIMFDLKEETNFVFLGCRSLRERNTTYDQVSLSTSIRQSRGSVVRTVRDK